MKTNKIIKEVTEMKKTASTYVAILATLFFAISAQARTTTLDRQMAFSMTAKAEKLTADIGLGFKTIGIVSTLGINGRLAVPVSEKFGIGINASASTLLTAFAESENAYSTGLSFSYFTEIFTINLSAQASKLFGFYDVDDNDIFLTPHLGVGVAISENQKVHIEIIPFARKLNNFSNDVAGKIVTVGYRRGKRVTHGIDVMIGIDNNNIAALPYYSVQFSY